MSSQDLSAHADRDDGVDVTLGRPSVSGRLRGRGCGKAVVPGGDAPEVPQPAEHPLDGVATAGEHGAEAARVAPVRLGWDGRHRAAGVDRTSEALRLDWRDVSLARRTILVARSKTRRARTVPMHPRVHAMLAELAARRGHPKAGPVFLIASRRGLLRDGGAGRQPARARPRHGLRPWGSPASACTTGAITGRPGRS